MKEYNRKILANNIKTLRRKKNLNQAELGKILHVSQQTIGSWETGRAIPGSDTLNTLADYFNVSTDELLGRKVDPAVSSDLDEMLDDIESYDGKLITDNDREAIRIFLQGRFSNK